jgi:small-conductance mechanosensitive channel
MTHGTTIWHHIGQAFLLLPPWASGTLLLLAVALAGGFLCRYASRFLRRWLTRFGSVPQMLLTRIAGPTCAIFVLMVVGGVLPVAPFDYATTIVIGHILLALFIITLGWAALNALDLAADLYLARLRLDVADNLLARKHLTQIRVLRSAARILVGLVTVSAALMTSAVVRQYGYSLFASAGAAGLVLGLAARPVLTNLLAGIQIAITQPIRLEDAVVVEGEWGWIEEIGSTYVVIRIWDLRRLIVPLSYFIEKPFQNWTHQGGNLMGTVMLHVDYSVPVDRVREKLTEFLKDEKGWDGKVAGVQVTDLPGVMVEVRILVSASNSGDLFGLRCSVREKMIAWLVQEYPESLPRQRAEIYASLPARSMFGEGPSEARGKLEPQPANRN